MTGLRQDLSYAFRTLTRAPAFTVIAVLVLAVGIGANTAIFTLVNELLMRPLSGRADELIGVYSRDTTEPDSYRPFSYPNYADIRDGSGVFDGLLAHTFTFVAEPAGDGTRRSLAAVVSSNYFDVLGVRLAAGRTFTPAEEQPGARRAVAIATHARWAREKFDPAFIGRTIRLNAEDFTIVGVAPAGFTGTMPIVSAEIYLPLGMFDTVVLNRYKNNGRGLQDRGNPSLVIAGRVRPGVTDAQVSDRLDVISRQLEEAYPVENRNQRLTAHPSPRMSASPRPQTNDPLALLTALLLGLSGTVLVIACLNIANMLLARGSARRREIAVRLALGARRSRIIRQLLTESGLLAAAGAGLGLLLSWWASRAMAVSLAGALPVTVTISATPDLAVLVATILFAGVSTVAFGLGPALRLSRRDVVVDLKDRGSERGAAGRRLGARQIMVVCQVSLSLAMLTAGGIFARTAVGAAATNPGYSYDRSLLAELETRLAGLDGDRARLVYDDVLARVRAWPGMRAASVASSVPYGETVESAWFEEAGSSDGRREPVTARAYRTIGADYFASLGLPMLRGREFTRVEESSASAPPVAIVDEMFARSLFEGRDPIGRTIRLAAPPGNASATSGEPLEIVGVAAPLREELLDRAPVPHVYVPFGRHQRTSMFLTARIEPGVGEQAALEGIRTAVRSVDARLPLLTLATSTAFHNASPSLWALQAGAAVFVSLGVLAMLVAGIGLYGVKSYVVAQRTPEIGLRMALGASGRDVLRLVLRDGAVLTGLGVAIGVPLAILVSVSFTKVFVEIGGIDATVIATATVVLTAAALLATLVPARRASRVQPLTALRHE